MFLRNLSLTRMKVANQKRKNKMPLKKALTKKMARTKLNPKVLKSKESLVKSSSQHNSKP